MKLAAGRVSTDTAGCRVRMARAGGQSWVTVALHSFTSRKDYRYGPDHN
jgi:hypothetical protein